MIVARRITHSTSKMITNGVCTCLLLTTVTFAKLKNKHVSSDSQPDITSDRLQEIHENAHNCTVRLDSSMSKRHAPSWVHLEEYTRITSSSTPTRTTSTIQDLNQLTLFASNDYGDDSNVGTLEFLLRSLQASISKASWYDGNTFKELMGGKYYLKDTTRFDSNDPNYLASNFNNEQVIISGATPLHCDWTFYQNGLYYTPFFVILYILAQFFNWHVVFSIKTKL